MKRTEQIFIVDDDPIFSELLIGVIEERGFFNIKTFFSGDDCLKEIHRKPSLVLLDYNLNGEKGIDTLKQIVSYDSTIPVIFVSGQADIQDAVDTLRYGAFDYVPKGGKFIEKLDTALDSLEKATAMVSKPSRLMNLFGLS